MYCECSSFVDASLRLSPEKRRDNPAEKRRDNHRFDLSDFSFGGEGGAITRDAGGAWRWTGRPQFCSFVFGHFSDWLSCLGVTARREGRQWQQLWHLHGTHTTAQLFSFGLFLPPLVGKLASRGTAA